MTSQEYWNKVANEKTFSTPFQLDIYKKYVNEDSRILDIGCGYGRTLEELQKSGYNNLIGIDFSKEMIKLAKTKNPSIDFRPTNGSILDFPDNSIDSVILLAVLTCIPDKDNQKQLIGEVHRVLKTEGIIYINDYLLNDTDMYLERYKKYQERYEYGVFETSDGGVFRHHSEEYLEELLSSFKTEEVKTLKYTTMNGHTSNGIYYIGRKQLYDYTDGDIDETISRIIKLVKEYEISIPLIDMSSNKVLFQLDDDLNIRRSGL